MNTITYDVLEIGDRMVDNRGTVIGFELENGSSYKIITMLGAGTYGKTFKVVDKNSKHYALKYLKPKRISGLIQECIIQILLAECSKDQPNGPYVPQLYTVAYNPLFHEAYVITELMEDTLHDVIKYEEEETNEMILKDALFQIVNMLIFLGEKLKFNHRDLKPDNIMYIEKNGKYIFKFIDFGFSCVTWNGLQISADPYFTTCYKKDRDFSQLLYAIARSPDIYPLTEQFSHFIRTLLRANLLQSKKTCKILKGCDKEGLKNWKNSYTFFNRLNVRVPLANMYTSKKLLERYIQGFPISEEPSYGNFQSSVNAFSKGILRNPPLAVTRKQNPQNPKKLYRNTRKINTKLIQKTYEP